MWKRSVAVGYRSKQKDENRQELSRKAQKQVERQFVKFYAAERGRPALATRLLVGLHYLKSL